MTDRGQVYTLEGIISALVVMAGLLFALQATTVTPQAGGVTPPQAQQQDRAVVQDVLTMADGETLREAVLYWDTGGGQFHCSPGGQTYYPAPGTALDSTDRTGCISMGVDRLDWVPPVEFGRLLHQQLGAGYSYNVHVAYVDGGSVQRTEMVYQGQPGDGVVRASTSVALTDDTRLYDADRSRMSETVGSTGLYGGSNVVFVEVVAWRG